MTTYVLRDGRFVDKHTGEPMPVDPSCSSIAMPAVRGDLPPYRSPVTGQVVEGRVARREDLARSGCREVDPSEFRPGYRDDRYARNNWEAKRKSA